MNVSSLAKPAVGVVAAVALLAGCGGGSSQQPGPLAPVTQPRGAFQSHASFGRTNTSLLAGPPKSVRLSATRDWTSAAVPGGELFVSDSGQNAIEIIGFRSGDQLGQISANLSEPQGMCVDKNTAWLANTGGSNLFQYDLAGKLIATIGDPGQFPVACSVHDGDVAVSNIINTSGGPGSVTIYPGGKGTGTNYNVSNLERVYFIGYDPAGDLYVTGETSASVTGFAYLKKGATSFTPVTLKGATVNFPGALQYAYGAFAIGDQSGSGGSAVVYRAVAKGSTLRVVREYNFPGEGGVQFFIAEHRIIFVASDGKSIDVYSYPAGHLVRTIPTPFLVEPVGLVLVK